MADRYVTTRALQQAIRRRETEVLKALRIPWQDGAPHIHCPYPAHDDQKPSWRWDEHNDRAHCTCIGRHSILDVVIHAEGLEFEAAKLRVAEILKLDDLIRTPGRGCQAMDPESLLRPPADQRDDVLPRSYLAYRLEVPADEVLMPSTLVVCWRELPYYDPPTKNDARPKLVGRYPCAVFDTMAPDGRQHAHRIYVEAEGAGKADLGVGPDGRPRDAKKAARLRPGQRAAGCAVLWGDPTALHLLLAEGIETSAALAQAHRAEVVAGDLMVAAALSTSGIRAFIPWPATRMVTIAADRDESKPQDDRGFKAGEKAARAFARGHHERLDVRIALPGDPGEDVDWLDVLRRAGVDAVRSGIAAASCFDPPVGTPASGDGEADVEASEDGAGTALREILVRARSDSSAPFEREALTTILAVRQTDPAGYQRAIKELKQAGVRLRDLERELRRTSFRVIEGGPGAATTDPAIAAGPYLVTSAGMIAWRKETRDGSAVIPLCNFIAQIVAEEVLDDGVERRTVLAIEGTLPDGRTLPSARVSAERFHGMSWVTEAWGTAVRARLLRRPDHPSRGREGLRALAGWRFRRSIPAPST